MIQIHFTDPEAKRRALGKLAGRIPSRAGRPARCWSRRLPWAILPSKAFRSTSRDRRPMSKTLRRHEVLLPLRFNDGQPVPEEIVAETLLELERQFGAVSCETQSIRGYWRYEGESYRDDLIRVFVDVADEPEHRLFFLAFKEQLKVRFQQLDIWMTTYLIEVL